MTTRDQWAGMPRAARKAKLEAINQRLVDEAPNWLEKKFAQFINALAAPGDRRRGYIPKDPPVPVLLDRHIRTECDADIAYTFERIEIELQHHIDRGVPAGHALVQFRAMPATCPELLLTATRRLDTRTGEWGPPRREISEGWRR